MSDQPPEDQSPADTPPGVPRWVKQSALVVGLLVVIGIVVMLLAAGDHGPGRHAQGQPASMVVGHVVTGLVR